jgi:hypothetical protein
LQKPFQPVLCKWKIGHRRAQVLCHNESIHAVTVRCQCEHLLQFDFNPNVADVGPAFFARKESVSEQTLGARKIACLGQISRARRALLRVPSAFW